MRQSGLLWVAAVLAVTACGGSSYGGIGGTTQLPGVPTGTPVQAASVNVVNNEFQPSVVLLAAGGKVTWNWVGTGHSVTSAGTPSFAPNAPISNVGFVLGPVTFAATGDYQYYCQVHGVGGVYGGGNMTGVIYVR